MRGVEGAPAHVAGLCRAHAREAGFNPAGPSAAAFQQQHHQVAMLGSTSVGGREPPALAHAHHHRATHSDVGVAMQLDLPSMGHGGHAALPSPHRATGGHAAATLGATGGSISVATPTASASTAGGAGSMTISVGGAAAAHNPNAHMLGFGDVAAGGLALAMGSAPGGTSGGGAVTSFLSPAGLTYSPSEDVVHHWNKQHQQQQQPAALAFGGSGGLASRRANAGRLVVEGGLGVGTATTSSVSFAPGTAGGVPMATTPSSKVRLAGVGTCSALCRETSPRAC